MCLLCHAACTTPLALFIQLGQLAIILPQRNQTAFITTVRSHLPLTHWMAVIEESKLLVFYASVAALFIRLCNDNGTQLRSIVQIFTVMNGWRLQMHQMWVHRQLPSWLFTTCVMPLPWKQTAASCLRNDKWKEACLSFTQLLSYWLFPPDLSTIIKASTRAVMDYILWKLMLHPWHYFILVFFFFWEVCFYILTFVVNNTWQASI